jgi:hypothetical protein
MIQDLYGLQRHTCIQDRSTTKWKVRGILLCSGTCAKKKENTRKHETSKAVISDGLRSSSDPLENGSVEVPGKLVLHVFQELRLRVPMVAQHEFLEALERC